MLENLLKLKEEAKDLLVLYVEDDEATRMIFENMLKKVFNNIVVAENGKEGLEKFKQINPDIVITDIQMPKMNGLDMSLEIKSINKSTPIVLMTAFEDSKYFIKSIEIGIDRYLLKPIKSDYMISVLTDIVELIKNNKIIEIYKKRELEEKIVEASFDMLKQTLESLSNPAIVYHDKKAVFLNGALKSILKDDIFNKISKHDRCLDEFIIQKNSEYLSSIFDVDNNEKSENKIFLTIDKRFFIFLINKNRLVAENINYELFVFTDITKLEYQKVKLENSKKIMKDFIIKTKYINHTKSIPDKHIEKSSTFVSVSKDNKEFINDEQKAVLRKSRVEKLSSVEFCSSIDDYTMYQIDELKELDSELSDLLSQIEDENDINLLYQIALKFKQYSRAIDVFIEFKDLSFAIASFADLIIATYNTIDDTKLKKLLRLMESVRLDLYDWRDRIFISKNTHNIHYLDSSLFSSCLQIEMILSQEDKEISDDENDLELF
ncbi:MAG: response regulator [Campylobacterales bacterium]|nr:response regulator [Campylobacterales bacterium]